MSCPEPYGHELQYSMHFYYCQPYMFVFGCIDFTALKYTIDADGKSMQFITIGQIVLLLLYLAYAAILQEMLLWYWFNSASTEFSITGTEAWL